MTAFLQFFRDTRGATMVEYAIMLALIAVISLGTLSALGSSVNHGLKTVSSCMSGGPGSSCAGKGGGGGKP